MTPSPRATVTTSQVLITPAILDIERAQPRSPAGEVVALVSPNGQDQFIKTTRYGWLRMPT